MRYQGNDGDFVAYEGKPEEAQAATNKARDYLIQNKDMVANTTRRRLRSSADVRQRGHLCRP